MLTIEGNFIYQRKGFYEVLLNKIAEKERLKAAQKEQADVLLARAQLK